MFRAILPAALFALLSLAGLPTSAEDKKKTPKGADPATTPLELSVTGKVTKYTTDVTTQKAADDLKNSIESAGKAGRQMPAAPAVDLGVEIKNTSDKPVTVWVSGDPVILTLTLKGKGAVNAAPQLAFTQEFRAPTGWRSRRARLTRSR